MFPQPLTADQIADRLGATVQGQGDVLLTALASMQTAETGELTFAEGQKFKRLAQCQASAAIVGPEAPADEMFGLQAVLRVESIPAAIATLLGSLAGPEDVPGGGIHPSCVVDATADVDSTAHLGPSVRVGPSAKIGAETRLCAGVSIGADVSVGSDCMLAEGVVVRYRCRIGDRVRIGPNSVIGYDGFGYYLSDGKHQKIPHIGDVQIDDDVELGACVCIDRAKWGSTRIGSGTKIDNLVQIAHNVQIDSGCLLASMVGIAGSTHLEPYVVLAGHVGLRDNITIGAQTVVGACSCVAQSVEGGKTLFGIPAKDARTRLKEFQALSKLPELLKRVKHLERTAERESPENH